MTIAGQPACTIYCGVADPDVASAAMSDHLAVDVTPDWERLTSTVPAGTITVTRMMFAPATKFTSVMRGTLNAIRKGVEVRPGLQDEVITHLQTCDMMLGIRIEPATTDDDPRLAAIYAMATATRGIVLADNTMHDATGDPLVEL